MEIPFESTGGSTTIFQPLRSVAILIPILEMKIPHHEEESSPPHVSHNGIEPVAIIGFGFKFPNDVDNADGLWELLMERRSTMTKVPKSRWNIDGFYKEHGIRPGTVKNRGGHFLADDPARFDAPFFSIPPAEAECMDPQQRLLLETSYHALENAGIPMQTAMGTRTSVHVGCLLQEYSQISQRDAQMPGDYRIVGANGLTMLANRLSWFYDFSGPSMTVDTACSGGLVALHLAFQELQAGSVDMSLVCGSNLCLLPDSTALLSSLNMMSKDSVCYSFDERASGYARGEGSGVLVLKRLSQALADGDTIRGVVRSTGCGQDGNTPTITSPSQAAQERLIRETYARAGLSLDDTRYFEAHGTGTPVGDPCEAAAISNVFSARTHEDPMYVGALKSNIGHLEGASGIAGVIKALTVLEKGIIPPNVYPERISPAVAAVGPNLRFPLEPVAWPSNGPRRASVNSFGYGGTNAHVVLDDALSFLRQWGVEGRHCTEELFEDEENSQTLSRLTSASSTGTGPSIGNYSDIALSDHTPPSSTIDHHDTNASHGVIQSSNLQLLVLSAFDERSVNRFSTALQKWISSHSKLDNRHQLLQDLAYTLVEKRTSFPWKSFCVASTNATAGLKWSAPARAKPTPNICFVYTGQGAQWYGMGRELLQYDVYRKSILEADQYLRSLGSSWSLIKEDVAIHQPERSQPICTAVQVAITDLLASWKVCATVCVGHSSGEIAAAYASRAISRESAWMIAYFRGLAVAIKQTLNPSHGAMVAVQAPLDSWKNIMEDQNIACLDGPIVIACYNSPRSFTISGPRYAIHRFVDSLRHASIEAHLLKIDVAYHSNHMSPVARVYERLLHKIEPGEPSERQPLFVSTVTGKPLDQLSELRSAEYWNRNLTGPVEFSAAIQEVCARLDASTCSFVEIGPHSVLRSPIHDITKSCNNDVASKYVSVLRRNHAADATVMECAGHLCLTGTTIDIPAVNKSHTSRSSLLTSLPSYQFENKKTYWLEGRTSIQYRQTQFPHHELLGSRTPDWNEHEAKWTNRILLDQSPYLKDHQVNGVCLMPAAGMLVMAIEAVRQLHNERSTRCSGYKMKNVTFTKAMAISGDPRGTEIELTVRPTRVNSRNVELGDVFDKFSIYIYEDDSWHLCCNGLIAMQHDSRGYSTSGHDEKQVPFGTNGQTMLPAMTGCYTSLDSADIYTAFDHAGLSYGPTFRGVREVKWDQQSQATGLIGLGDWEKHARQEYSDPHLIHPAALDTILQMTFPTYSIYEKTSSATTVPTGFNNAWFSNDLGRASSLGSDVIVHAKVIGHGFRNKLFAIHAACAEDGAVCFYGELETSTIGRVNASSDPQKAVQSFYRIDWQPAKFHRIVAEMDTMASSPSYIHIVYDELDAPQLDMIHALCEALASQGGLRVVMVPWSSVVDYDLVGALCVFFPGLDGSLLHNISADSLEKIKRLILMTEALVWITVQHQHHEENPKEGLISGLLRTLATEADEYCLVSLCLDTTNGMSNTATNIIKVINQLLQQQKDPEDEYWEIDGVLCTPRVVDDAELTAELQQPEQPSTTVLKAWKELDRPKLTIDTAGILNTLHYQQDPLQSTRLGDDDVVVAVKAVGLNTRDLQVALGQVHDDAFGIEIAGVVLQAGKSCAAEFQVGDRVFGVTRHGVAQMAQCKSFQLRKMAHDMSFKDATAMPVAFCVAYYALVWNARVTNGDVVFIHDAAGALGQAVIQISRHQRCARIFATVHTIEEVEFLTKTFGIPGAHIFLTDEPDLEHRIRRLTGGRGVDVVLGSRASSRASWGCIAPFGRCIDVGEKDSFVSPASGSEETFLPPTTSNVTYTSINFQELTKSRLFSIIFKEVHSLIDSGKISIPKPIAVFRQNEVEQAFRALEREGLAGKVILEMKEEEVVEMRPAPGDCDHLFRSDASYLIAGAFGGIGQSIVQWMVRQGARHLILPSRSLVEGTNSSRERFIQMLRAQGVMVQAPVCDIANKNQLQSTLQRLSGMPEIRGCIQAAMVICDSSFPLMTAEKWNKSLAPKVDGSWNLHQILPSNLDFFVMLSSSTGIIGSFGQSNYTVGNTYQDNLAAHRMKHGQRAHALALSMVTGVGYMAQNEQVGALLRVRGVLEEVSMQDIQALLRFCCNPTRVDAANLGPQIITPLTLPADLRAVGIVAPLGVTRPIYNHLHTLPARISSTAHGADVAKSRWAYKLAEATTLAQATHVVIEAVQTQLSSLLVVSKEDIDPQKAIHSEVKWNISGVDRVWEAFDVISLRGDAWVHESITP
ncbi:polyketide synthase PksJ [Stemphylium lycopersici]|nr:polyketide synthase PksJ [Stemphylium lycopersici]